MKTDQGRNPAKLYDLILLVVGHREAGKLIQFAKKHGMRGASVLIGSGTRRNTILSFLGLDEVRRDVILSVCERSAVAQLLEAINAEYKLDKPGMGIAAVIPLACVLGTEKEHWHGTEENPDTGEYGALVNIVDRSKGMKIVDLADDIGINGATVFSGRGTADLNKRIFDFPIEPAKDIVLVLAKKHKQRLLAQAIRENLGLEKENTGIQFLLPVSQTIGLYPQDENRGAEVEEKLPQESDKAYYAFHVVTTPDFSDKAAKLMTEGGSKGASIMPGRGSGAHDTQKFLAMPVEPRKDIVLSVMEAEVLSKIAPSICDELELDKPGMGIAYAIKLLQVFGLREG